MNNYITEIEIKTALQKGLITRREADSMLQLYLPKNTSCTADKSLFRQQLVS